jgi:hypothetical protein
VEALAFVLTSGWASGINLYATVLVSGLAGRYGGFDLVPHPLQRTDVLVVGGFLAVCEFTADKIPYVDSAWDLVHTAIRPTFAAAIGAMIAGQAGDLNEGLAAALGGTTALTSHATKASLRLAVNASPEPFTNIALSLSEDSAVVAVLLLAVHHPWPAAAAALAILATGLVLVTLLVRRIRRGLARALERRPRPSAAT